MDSCRCRCSGKAAGEYWRPGITSKPVKLQRPGSGYRVQSLSEETWPPDSEFRVRGAPGSAPFGNRCRLARRVIEPIARKVLRTVEIGANASQPSGRVAECRRAVRNIRQVDILAQIHPMTDSNATQHCPAPTARAVQGESMGIGRFQVTLWTGAYSR